MILTAIKNVNARIGKPSTNAPNPRFLLPGDKVKVVSRVLGDSVFGNLDWIITDENEFFSAVGFHNVEELKSIPFFAHLQNIPPVFKALDISQLWNFSKGEKINVGIIDNGVAQHPVLNTKVTELNTLRPPTTELDNHGTTMACIIGALKEATGQIGIAPMVENIYSYRIDVADGVSNVVATELQAALAKMEEKGVNIINMSFASQHSSFFLTNESGRSLQKKIDNLAEKGCILVCSTGNDSERKRTIFPASYDNVISVTGYNRSGSGLNIPSNYWEGVSVAMSVQHYFDNTNDPLFQNSNGTSSAAAILSGCLACTYSKLKVPKMPFIQGVLRSMPMLGDSDNPFIRIPKFQTENFIQLLKS